MVPSGGGPTWLRGVRHPGAALQGAGAGVQVPCRSREPGARSGILFQLCVRNGRELFRLRAAADSQANPLVAARDGSKAPLCVLPDGPGAGSVGTGIRRERKRDVTAALRRLLSPGIAHADDDELAPA